MRVAVTFPPPNKRASASLPLRANSREQGHHWTGAHYEYSFVAMTPDGARNIYCTSILYVFLFRFFFFLARVCSEDVISVWNRSASNTEGIEKMRETLKRLLKIPPFVQVYIHDPCNYCIIVSVWFLCSLFFSEKEHEEGFKKIQANTLTPTWFFRSWSLPVFFKKHAELVPRCVSCCFSCPEHVTGKVGFDR